jgi:hypothetical protein
MPKIYPLLLAGLLIPATSLAADTANLVICYPGGPVSAKEANTAIASMLRIIERLGQWQANSLNGTFTSKLDECRQQIHDQKLQFAITSQGLFLELHSTHDWVPLVQPNVKGQSNERYRVIVQQGKFQSFDALKGKTLGGTVLEEPEFISKIVFAGQYHTTDFALKPSNQPIRALRALDNGELDAVILNEQQYSALSALSLQHPVEAVFTSADIPLIGVIADKTSTTAEDRKRFSLALSGLCTDAEGKKLCELFGVESFSMATAEVFASMFKLWGGK